MPDAVLARSPHFALPGLALLAAALVAAGCNVFTGADDLEVVTEAARSPAGPAGTDEDGSGGSAAVGGAGGGAGGTTTTTTTTTTAPADPCAGVDCGAHGHCDAASGAPACACDGGYHAEGLSCVADAPSCACGPNAACAGGGCVCNDGFEWMPGKGCSAPSAEELAARAELVQIAMGELGKCEGPADQNPPYMNGQPGLWCFDFLAWVYSQGTHGVGMGSARTAADLALGWRPGAGDVIKFTYQHYGMVVSASPDGQVIDTVEGNVNQCVMTRTVGMDSIAYIQSLAGVL